jgi:hypothetical protein
MHWNHYAGLSKDLTIGHLFGLHGKRVIAHMPLWIAPITLLPAPTPDWASAAETRNFIDVPFDGFLAPPSEIVVLTRILRHRN